VPRLVKGGKWAYGWVIVGAEREILIPPEAWREFGFRAGEESLFTPGSRASGGFAISTQILMAEATTRLGGAALRIIGRARFADGQVITPPGIGLEPGDKLLAVRGSRFGLGFVAQGPIYEEALKHTNLEVFGW
jgi:hypothetical protein